MRHSDVTKRGHSDVAILRSPAIVVGLCLCGTNKKRIPLVISATHPDLIVVGFFLGLDCFSIVWASFLAILPGRALPCDPLNSLPLKDRLSPLPIFNSPQCMLSHLFVYNVSDSIFSIKG